MKHFSQLRQEIRFGMRIMYIKFCGNSYAGNWELVKLIVGTKFRRSHVSLRSQAEWLCSSSLCYGSFCTKTDTGDKIKYSRIPKNTETQQENTKENTKKTTEINWD